MGKGPLAATYYSLSVIAKLEYAHAMGITLKKVLVFYNLAGQTHFHGDVPRQAMKQAVMKLVPAALLLKQPG